MVLNVLKNDFPKKYNMYVIGNIYDVGDPIIKSRGGSKGGRTRRPPPKIGKKYDFSA